MTELLQLAYAFFDANGYVLELVLAVAAFIWWMERRPHFWCRLAGMIALLFAVSLLWETLCAYTIITQSLRILAFFLLACAGVCFCFNVDGRTSLYYVTAACAAQHLSFKVARTCLSPLWLIGGEQQTLLAAGYPLLFLLILWGCHLSFGRALHKSSAEHLQNSSATIMLLVGMQLCTNIFQNVYDFFSAGGGYGSYTVFNLFDIVCCLFLLSLQSEISRRESELQSNQILKQLLYQQKQQMENSKETIDLINIKCHDIKKQIAMLGNRIPAEEIDELNKAISVYDTTMKTGNEALDILISEKSLLCEKKQIRFTCIADGTSMGFLKQSDLYSLFGNALDNAIEGSERVEEPALRYVSVKASVEKGMLMIHFENRCEGPITFVDGLPQTSKKDKRYHGFGMKSIRMITEKYGGYLSAKADKGVFSLNILLPLPR